MNDSQKAKSRFIKEEVTHNVGEQPVPPVDRYPSPVRTVLILVISIFLAELFIMTLLYLVPVSSTLAEIFIDSVLLIVIIFPALHFFLLRPLVSYYKERKRSLAQRAEEMARYNAELEQFAYVASHDLQEPLRMVASYTQLLARRYKGKLDADADEFIAYAVDGASRMQRLINDLLAYSRVGTRGKPFEETNCETVFDQALTNLQVVIRENSAVVKHDTLPILMSDPSQLGQLFQNLIGNAIKFRGDKLPEVYVGSERRDGEWLFAVRDNGIGIKPEFSERIFNTFVRLNDKTEYPGTGIGLAICKRIVDRHGGHIWVDSEPGRGSTFYFTIPVRGGR